MDKKSLYGLLLIFGLVMMWMMWQSSTYKAPKEDNIKKDSVSKPVISITDKSIPQNDSLNSNLNSVADSTATFRKYGTGFSDFSKGTERIITIETDNYIAKISNKGTAIKKWQLKHFDKWDKSSAQLIWSRKGELFLSFVTFDGILIDSRDLFFSFENLDNDYIKISGKNKFTLNSKLEVTPGKFIQKTITFKGNEYVLDQNVTLQNMESFIPARGYNLNWAEGIRYQEHNSVDESNDAHSIVSANGIIEEIDASEDKPVEQSFDGDITYLAIKTKYFGMAIMPQPTDKFNGNVSVKATKIYAKNKGIIEKYSATMQIPYNGGTLSNDFKVFIGPLQYDLVKNYGLEELINLGWRYGIRQIGEYFMLPILKFIYGIIPNYGLAIIVFSFLMKFLLYPLSITQMKSAQKMQLLAPLMKDIREKYKDDNTKQQQEIMKMYSEYGVNPAGGCLPLVLQMPILFALWQVLRSAIDMRQQDFIFWITDLSAPDKLFSFGFEIMGISFISGLALLMGITMFFQQKLTITDPNQKAMVYMMPVMFTLMFSNFPAGLNLYYLVFNLLSIGQQVYINKYSKNRPTLDELKRMPKKESWLQKKMAEAQKLAESQGRTVPGKKNFDDNVKKPNTQHLNSKNKKK